MSMYEAALVLHSLFRWFVIAAGAVAIARAAGGLASHRPWTPADAAASRWFVTAMSVQFVVGLLLWAFLSPFGASALADMAGAMKDPTRRFWAVEHITMMILSLGVAHVGAARVRKARGDARKHRSAVIFFALSLVLALIAIPWTGPDARPWFRWF
jgi:cytochrome c biogenesis protein CcdA